MEVLASMGIDPTPVTAFPDFLVTDVNKGKVCGFFSVSTVVTKTENGKMKNKNQT